MKRTLAIALLVAVGAGAHAQVLFTGAPLTQNFDTLPTAASSTWTDNTTLTGWYSNRTTILGDDGSSNSGGIHSYGTTGSAERALGGLGSGSANPVLFGARIVNAAGGTVQQVTVSYRGEQWRDANTTAQTLFFEYSQDAATTSISTGTWTAVSALDFTGPKNANAGKIDGNAAGNNVLISNTFTLAANWNAGSELWIRWRKPDAAGSDHGLAVDEMRFEAQVVPEPATFLVFGAGLAMLKRRKR